MPYYFTLEGVGEIKCDTIEELRAAAGQHAGQITDISVQPPRKPGAGRPPKKRRLNREAKSPGIGPERSWALAEWHSIKTNTIKNDARAALSKIRKEAPKKFIELTEEFEKLVQWYTGKIKASSVEEARTALRRLYEEDIEKYKAAVLEYDKKKK